MLLLNTLLSGLTLFIVTSQHADKKTEPFDVVINELIARPEPTSRHAAKEAEPFDVVINEIMARPAPVVGLPEAEYIELFNRSSHPVDLQNWTVSVGTRSRILTDQRIINPGKYLLVAHEKFGPLLEEFGEVAGIAAFPVLPASGQTIVLRNEKGNVISAVEYSDNWYGSNLKASGGWSLEQIDPFNPCGGVTNWRASTDASGGTPGSKNSVSSDNPDNIPPVPVRATMLSQSSIRLHFSKPMHPSSSWSSAEYSADGAGHPLYCIPVKPFFDAVDLFFGRNFEPDIQYTLKLQGGLYDCAGNFIVTGNSSVRFALPEYPEDNEIIINEILFNPLPGGTGFIELVNISRKTFDLRHLVLSGMKQGNPGPSYVIAPGGYLLFPGDYAVLTTDPETVMNHYFTPYNASFVIMEQMPPMPNEWGRVIIAGLQGNILDDLSYNSDMHSPLLTVRKGVSLERLSYERPACDPSNWHSASESSGFATPGYKNSQSMAALNIPVNILTVDPKIFSPDNSGYNDVVTISYDLEKPGYAGSIIIFDSRGRLVKRLARNELLGISGKYSWNGRNEANHQQNLGIYIIMMEIFHPDGDVKKHKETVVLAGRIGN